MKKTPIPKKSKTSKARLERKLWELCKLIIRKRYGNTCYTCSKTGLESFNWHTGHMIAKASLSNYLKYDLRLLRPQCYHCNINLGGMGAEFLRRMEEIEGKDYTQQIFNDRKILIKADEIWFAEKIAEYQKLLDKNLVNG